MGRPRRRKRRRAPNVPTETIRLLLEGTGSAAFSAEGLRRLTGLTPLSAQARLHRLVREGVLRRVLHGWYVVRGPEEAEVLGDPFFLGTRLVEPSYVAFGTALHFHGWTEEAPPVTFVASPRRSRLGRAGRHRVHVVQVAPQRFFGYATVRRGRREFAVADPEKAIVDALEYPGLCGGMEAVIAALERALPSLDVLRLQAYAARMDSRSLCSRLGYVLETLGAEARSLRPFLSDGYVKLDSRGPRKGRYSSRWRVVDNL